jgi:hypothetical protein
MPRRTSGSPLAFLTAAATISVCAAAGAAPPPERTPAEMLDAQGTALMQERRYEEACPKLSESERLEPGTGVLLRLALCDEQIGKTASAWSAFREAAARAQRSGDEALRQLATKRADGLAARVPRVILELEPAAEYEPVTLTCDGNPLDRSALGAEVPMDPGTHAVEARGVGRPVIRKTFTLAARDALVIVTIELPADPEGGDMNPRNPARVQRTTALVVGGVGVAGVAVGAIFGVAAMSSWNRARSECTSGVSGCSRDALDLQPVVKSDATWSTVGFVVGAAGLLGAALLWWTEPRHDHGTGHAGATLRPVLGANRLGLELGGGF